jgi:Type IV secretion-system coupling protein DNA-binding domain
MAQDALFESKSELVRRFLEVKGDERPIGEIILGDLPEPYFRTVVEHHNRQLEKMMGEVPEGQGRLRWRILSLRIPTFEEFQTELAGKESKLLIAAHLRRASFGRYRRWLAERHSELWETFLQVRFPYVVSEANLARHTYLVGQTGSGKTEFLKLLCATTKERPDGQAGVSHERSLLVVDPGNLAWQVAHFRMYAEDFEANPEDPNLIYISPLLEEGRYPVINPFDISARTHSEEEVDTLAEQLTGALIAITKEEKFSLPMRTVLKPCLKVIIRRADSTLYDLLRFMDYGRNTDLIDIGRQSESEATRTFFEGPFLSNQYHRTRGAIATKIQSLLNESIFARMIAGGKSTINLEAALNGGKSVVVSVPKAAGGEEVSEAIGRFFVAMTLGIALNRGRSPTEFRRPINIVLDEAQNYLSKQVKTIVVEARQFACQLVGAQQVVGQEMNPELEKIILENTNIKIIGKSGHHSRQKMAREMEVPPEHLAGLEVGTFVIKAGSGPAVRLTIDRRYLGDRQSMRPDQWEALKAAMLERYYRHRKAPQTAIGIERSARESTTDPEEAQPMESVAAPVTGRRQRRPKYELDDVFDLES